MPVGTVMAASAACAAAWFYFARNTSRVTVRPDRVGLVRHDPRVRLTQLSGPTVDFLDRPFPPDLTEPEIWLFDPDMQGGTRS